MHEAELFVALLSAVVLIALAARRLERFPDAVALVLGGIVAGLLPFAPDVELDPEVIFAVFLPPILYPAAFEFAFEDVRSQLRPIGFLAFGLVLATIGAVAVAMHLVAGMPWAPAFVLGAVLSPTDPVAAAAVIRSGGAPSRLSTVLEGESLINDGTALTALRLAIAAVGGTFSLTGAVGEFALTALGGAAIGATLAFAVSRLRRGLDDLELESALGVLLAFGAFLLAEQVGVSGVLAVVAAGYGMGRSRGSLSAGTRTGGESFWSVARFLSESMLFLLVGIAFAQVLEDPATRPAGELIGLTALAAGTALGVRLLWMFTVPYLAGLFDRPRGLGAVIGVRERAVIGFAGLRGAVSVAAALTIPASVDGTDFPERSTILAVAVGAIVVLLVLPALTLGRVLQASGLAGAEDTDERAARARADLADAALRRMQEVAAGRDVPEDVLVRIREHYAAGADQLDLYRELFAEAVGAQRRRLAELRREGEVDGELLRDLERDLNVEELRLR